MTRIYEVNTSISKYNKIKTYVARFGIAFSIKYIYFKINTVNKKFYNQNSNFQNSKFKNFKNTLTLKYFNINYCWN